MGARASASYLHPLRCTTWPDHRVSPLLFRNICYRSEWSELVASGTGFHPHLPGFKYKFLSTTLGATMWFFIFYRARYVLIFWSCCLILIFDTERMAESFWYCHTQQVVGLNSRKRIGHSPMGRSWAWARRAWSRCARRASLSPMPIDKSYISTQPPTSGTRIVTRSFQHRKLSRLSPTSSKHGS